MFSVGTCLASAPHSPHLRPQSSGHALPCGTGAHCNLPTSSSSFSNICSCWRGFRHPLQPGDVSPGVEKAKPYKFSLLSMALLVGLTQWLLYGCGGGSSSRATYQSSCAWVRVGLYFVDRYNFWTLLKLQSLLRLDLSLVDRYRALRSSFGSRSSFRPAS